LFDGGLTFFIASADTGPAPEMARDAVDMPTPASIATSFSVATQSPMKNKAR
jgi:hypothetical protein